MNETISLKDRNGLEFARLNFNPYDMGIIIRYQDFGKTMEEIKKIIQDNADVIRISNDGSGMDDESKKLIAEMEPKVFRAFDRLLDSDGASLAIFSTTRPFASVNGEFYLVRALEAIKDFVSDRCVQLCQKNQKPGTGAHTRFEEFRRKVEKKWTKKN